MIRKAVVSAGHALRGITNAIYTERNLKLFVVAFAAVLFLAVFFGVTVSDWCKLLLAGGTFIAIELINTALERMVDAFDDHVKQELDTMHYEALRATKDIAAGAALVSGMIAIAVTLMVFWPYALERL